MARTHDILPETSPAGQAQFLVAFHQQQNPHFEEAAKGLRSASRPNIFMKTAPSLQFPGILPEILPLAPGTGFGIPS